MDLGDPVLNSLVGATVFFDAGRIYLVGRNLEVVWSAEQPPRDLQNFVEEDDYKLMRQDAISEVRYEATHVAFTFGVKLLKLSLRYYPTIWNLTGNQGTSLFKRAALFYAIDSLLTRTVFVPVAFVDALINKKLQDPFSIFVDSILRNVVNAAMSAVGAMGIIYITDTFGTAMFVVVTVASNVFGLLLGALRIKIRKQLLEPLRTDSLGDKVKNLAKHVHFPEKDIYIDHKRRSPLEVKYENYLGVKMITINQSLLTVLTPEQTVSLVAHELGNWYNHQPIFEQAFSILHSSFMCFVCVKSLGNDWITEHFGFPEKAHTFVSLYLSVYYFWPLINAVLDGFNSISRRRSVFMADEYANAEGHGSNLRTTILTLAGQRRCYPIFDHWYSGWVYGYPTVFERIARLDPKKRVSFGNNIYHLPKSPPL
ncbi:hypothetical protein GE061_018239 [Apolygus lucorum]|uniref:Uncharacterized protein n=1 Tax=Apolygus lucorum TaxID=248454 RepID=A0A6A4IJZ1_APOLU|nr:hypothetical protein GE061_018239 [Apolygus lucorum]